MSTRENLQALKSDVVNTRRDFEKTISQISQTVENARARFDPLRIVQSHPYMAAAVAVMIGGFLGFRGRSSKEFLNTAARALVASAFASAFWAMLNK